MQSLNIEFEKSFTVENIIEVLDNSEGCKVVDERRWWIYNSDRS